MKYKKQIIEFIDKLDEESRENMLSILNMLELDPGITYHKLSSIYNRFKWPIETKTLRRTNLIKKMKGKKINLPKPDISLEKNIFEVLLIRRSVRAYKKKGINLRLLGNLLYYSVGMKGKEAEYPIRMFPSAGALQPIETYLVVSNVNELNNGIYHYEPDEHVLVLIREGNYIYELYKYSLEQEHILEAPLNIILSVVYNRTRSKYGFRAYRYILLDTGHVGMNIYTVSTALGLSTCAVGVFEDESINKLLNLDNEEFVLMIYPIGYKKIVRELIN